MQYQSMEMKKQNKTYGIIHLRRRQIWSIFDPSPT